MRSSRPSFERYALGNAPFTPPPFCWAKVRVSAGGGLAAQIAAPGCGPVRAGKVLPVADGKVRGKGPPRDLSGREHISTARRPRSSDLSPSMPDLAKCPCSTCQHGQCRPHRGVGRRASSQVLMGAGIQTVREPTDFPSDWGRARLESIRTNLADHAYAVLCVNGIYRANFRHLPDTPPVRQIPKSSGVNLPGPVVVYRR